MGCVLFCLAIAWSADVRAAESLVWTLTGRITRLEQNRPFWNDTVRTGAVFTVVSEFQTPAADRDPNPDLGYFAEAGFVTSLTLGDYTFRSPTGFLWVMNDKQFGDVFRDGYVWSVLQFDQLGLTGIAMQGHLHATDLSLISNDALDIRPFEIAAFDLQRNFSLTASFSSGRDALKLEGIFTGHTVAPIPEPSIWELGAAGLALMRWSRLFRPRCQPLAFTPFTGGNRG